MKALSIVFLEKRELQHSGNSILGELFGIPSNWGSQNDKFQQKYFQENIGISDTRKTTEVKKKYSRKLKKDQNSTILVKFSDRFLYFLHFPIS